MSLRATDPESPKPEQLKIVLSCPAASYTFNMCTHYATQQIEEDLKIFQDPIQRWNARATFLVLEIFF